MGEEYQRSTRKSQSMRSASTGSNTSSRSDKKARSYRDETYKPADPSKPAPQTIYLKSSAADTSSEEYEKITRTRSSARTRSVSDTEGSTEGNTEGKQSSFLEKLTSPFAKLKSKYEEALGNSSGGSSYRRKKAQKQLRNDLIKKAIIILIAILVLILIIVLIVNSTQVNDVSNVSIESTATTQTLQWTGAKKGLTYEVYRAEGAGGEYTLVDTLTEGENTKSYDNLTAGTLYRYKIVTVKGESNRTEGTVTEAYTKPNAVTGTSAVTTEEKSLTAQWNLQGSTDSYELKYGLYDNLRDAQTISFPSTEAIYDSNSGTYSYQIGNLVTDETYYMAIRTVCGEDASEWSPTFSGTVSATPVTADTGEVTKMVALTFDSGPDGDGVTERILNVLKENEGKATFFQTGANAQTYPDIMKRIVDEGHEVGSHTYDDSHVGGDITADDIINANSAIEDACGVYPKLFRAPQGELTDAITNVCTDEGMSIVLWNFDSHDWEFYEATDIIDRIETYVEDGDLIQFRNIYPETAEAIETLVPYLVDEGYELVTVSELFKAKTGETMLPGKIYRSAYEEIE